MSKIPIKRNSEYQLTLFITGASHNSVRAINTIKFICEKYLQGNYILEIVDVYQFPEIAYQEKITVLPALINKGTEPHQRLIGDLSDIQWVLRGLGINFMDKE
ncbi:circadian clock protein KaiB [Pedobacter cryoconitis]|uniref:Circadian clock protein KaiB n=1 Tax=Pedobacter cryoconitis TaxID=188932 RepID=A0A7W9E066_9SPHI|nr:circadian clock KaiB family protein [Pedobacter cryoconitis]MBB5637731.1 circadian clock protein KaiB [Pedobacter cryoconitis]